MLFARDVTHHSVCKFIVIVTCEGFLAILMYGTELMHIRLSYLVIQTVCRRMQSKYTNIQVKETMV